MPLPLPLRHLLVRSLQSLHVCLQGCTRAGEKRKLFTLSSVANSVFRPTSTGTDGTASSSNSNNPREVRPHTSRQETDHSLLQDNDATNTIRKMAKKVGQPHSVCRRVLYSVCLLLLQAFRRSSFGPASALLLADAQSARGDRVEKHDVTLVAFPRTTVSQSANEKCIQGCRLASCFPVFCCCSVMLSAVCCLLLCAGVHS